MADDGIPVSHVPYKFTRRPRDLEDLVGKKYFRLTVVAFSHHCREGKRHWLFRCECGNPVTSTASSVSGGWRKSCGCLRKEKSAVTGKRNTTHGMTGSRLAATWSGMRQRCYNPKAVNYADYGGRGIRICDEWLEDPATFYRWALENGYRDDLEIDRENNDGYYEPGNCRFITLIDNQNNKRNNVRLEHGGESLTVAQWARRAGIHRDTFTSRLELGWPIKKAVETPVIQKCRRRPI
jgi:hypothetical protein